MRTIRVATPSACGQGRAMLQTILALLVFLFPLAWSPGPGNLFFAANGARFGARATVALSAGYHIATFLVAAAIGLGMAGLIAARPGLMLPVRIAGALYVALLALRFLRAGPDETGATARPAGFRDGAVLLLLNPKAWVIMLLLFSQFSGALPLPPAIGALTVALIFTLNNLVAFTAWTLAGQSMARRFASRTQARLLNRLFGAALLAVAVWMLLP